MLRQTKIKHVTRRALVRANGQGIPVIVQVICHYKLKRKATDLFQYSQEIVWKATQRTNVPKKASKVPRGLWF